MKKQNIILTLLSILLVAAVTTGTFAWYRKVQTDFGPASIGGVVRASYFESGDGTERSRYEIKYPEQFYNLAWLQYLGYFNNDDNLDENGGLKTTYFYLSENLDMTGYVLPPIGTTTNPFIGNFNGNGKTISNLTIANTVENNTGLEMATEDEDVSGAEIIGLFGVVGEYKGNVKYNYASAANEVKDFTINNLTVNSQTDKCLIGIVAGYVNGTVSGVGVINSNINIKNNTDVLDAEILSTGYSDTSLFGYVEKYYRNAVRNATLYGEISAGESGGEESDTERGTINMLDIYKRVSYMFGAKYQGFIGFENTSYHINLTGTNLQTKPFVYNHSFGNEIFYLQAGTYLPISIDHSTIEEDEIQANTVNNKISNSYAVTNEYYRTHSTESVLSNNTGYIVGYGYDKATRLSFKPENYMGDTKNTKAMYGIVDGNWRVLTDSNLDDNHQNYDLVYKTLFGNDPDDIYSGTLFQRTDGGNYTPCLSFEGRQSGTVSSQSYNVTINGQNKDIKLIENGVDFFINKDQILTVAMAANYGTSGTQITGADLYVVDRSGDTPPTTKKISKVYVDSSNNVYNVYENGARDSYAGDPLYTLRYDRSWMTNWTAQRLYYFEIPLSTSNSEEYYITNYIENASRSNIACFVYLDIAPNGGAGIDIGGAMGALSMTETVYKHQVNDGANFIASNADSIDNDVPCAEYKITNADTYNYSRTGNNLTITSDSEGTPAYIEKGITVTAAGHPYVQSDLSVEDPELWTVVETRHWTIVYMNDKTFKLYLGKEEVPADGLTDYQYIIDKFNAYLEENPIQQSSDG